MTIVISGNLIPLHMIIYKKKKHWYILLSNSGPDHLKVNTRCLPGPLQLNLYLRFRRSGPE